MSLTFLGIAIVLFKGVHLISVIGNMGTYNKSFLTIAMDKVRDFLCDFATR